MYTGLIHAHHWLRYIALILIVISLVKAVIDLKHKGETISNKKTELYTLIAMHLQLIIGLVLFFISPAVKGAMSNMGAAMKDSAQRLVLVEHPLIMIIAILLITVGYMKLKKIDNRAKYGKTVLVYYGIATLLILSRIPMYSW